MTICQCHVSSREAGFAISTLERVDVLKSDEIAGDYLF
jgi:hypothetical protein